MSELDIARLQGSTYPYDPLNYTRKKLEKSSCPSHDFILLIQLSWQGTAFPGRIELASMSTSSTLSREYSHLHIYSYVEKFALRL